MKKKTKKTTSGATTTTRSHCVKTSDDNPTITTTSQNKTSQASQRTKKGTTTPNKTKADSNAMRNWGGVQTNEIDAVADDELSSQDEDAEVDSVDEISVTESGTDSNGSEVTWLEVKISNNVLGPNPNVKNVPRPQLNKVSREPKVPTKLPMSTGEITSIVICPPTPEPTEAVSTATPLTTVSGGVPSSVMEQDPSKATNNTTRLQVRYGPDFFYWDIESGKYCFNCEKRHQNICVHEVVVGLKRGTTFTAHISNKRCHALVDTGASHSCMSLAFYEQLSLPPVNRLVGTTVWSATRSNLEPLGIVECNVKLGQKTFKNTIIVCHNMHWPLILGEDFLSKNALWIYYDEQGKWHLEYKHEEELITSTETKQEPKIVLWRACSIPGQLLAVLNVWSTITKQHEGRVYDVQVDENLSNEHPNLVIRGLYTEWNA